MLSREKNGCKPLLRLAGVRKDSTCHLMGASYGQQQVKTEQFSLLTWPQKKLKAKLDAKVTGANRLKFTPDGKLEFISSLQSGVLTIYDAKEHTKVKQLKLGRGAAGILMDPAGSRAFVACSADNYIAVIDLKTLEDVRHFDVGGVPDGMAWAVQQ